MEAGVGLCERVSYNAWEWVVTDIQTPPQHLVPLLLWIHPTFSSEQMPKRKICASQFKIPLAKKGIFIWIQQLLTEGRGQIFSELSNSTWFEQQAIWATAGFRQIRPRLEKAAWFEQTMGITIKVLAALAAEPSALVGAQWVVGALACLATNTTLLTNHILPTDHFTMLS